MAKLMPPLLTHFDDDNGKPLSGGRVFFYEAGTNTPKDTYTDANSNIPNTNPVVLNARGDASIWLKAGEPYKAVICRPDLTVVRTVDNITRDAADETAAVIAEAVEAAKAETLAARDDAVVRANMATAAAGMAASQAGRAESEAERAEAAAGDAGVSAAAALAAQNTYASTAAGLAGTTSGQVFLVATADPQVFDVYRNNAGAAVLLGALRIADQADVDAILDMLDIGDHGNREGFAIIDDHENVIAELTSESEFRVPSLSAQLAKIDIAEVEQIDVVPVEGGSVVQVVDDHGNVAAEITPEGLFRAELEAVVEIVPGSGVEVDNSNPRRPVISATASGALSYRSPGDVGGKPFNEKDSWSAHHLLLTASTTIAAGLSGSASVYWPCIVTTERLESPLGRYYMFFSTDHAAGQGGIFMAYADSVLGPWTPVGRVYWDSAGLQTETPDVIWSEHDQCWVMYYQQNGAKYGPDDSLTPIGVQSTLCATSTDLLSWTKDPNFVIQKVPGMYGDGHTGYFRSYWTPEGLCARSLFGGTDYAMTATYRHRGGTLKGFVSGGIYLNQWDIIDVQPSFFESDKKATNMLDQKITWSSHGVDWAVVTYGQTSSGVGSRVMKHYAVPLDKNRRNIYPDVRFEIWEAEEVFDGGGDIRSSMTFVENGIVYVLYTTAVGSTNSNRLGVFFYEQ